MSSLKLMLGSAFVLSAIACNTDLDCSLNGICGSGNVCKCDTPWSGTTCDLLDVLPTIPESGYNGTAVNMSSWGGSIVQDDDGSWHLFVAEMANNCGLSSWTTNSQVVHMVADDALGPYVRSEVVVPIFSHNPTVRRVNGTWLLYHIGHGDGETQPRLDCSGGITPAGDSPFEQGSPHYTMVRSALSLHGPWTPLGEEIKITHPDTFLRPKSQWTTNPAPWFQGSDVWFPYRNPASYWTEGDAHECLGMAKGSNATGPFQDLTPDAPIVPFATEDPYLWIDARGNFHMLTHKKDPSLFSPDRNGSLGHIYSQNGVEWYASANSPVSKLIALQDGSTVKVGQLARPQLFIENGSPKYLSAGTGAFGPGDHTTTVVLPLRGSAVESFV